MTNSIPQSVSPREARQAAGWSLDKAAAYAGVSTPTARAYELSRDAVKPAKRAALDRIYVTFQHAS
jgi:transcriptional regulator with XRE-family HTH domain